MVEGEKKEDLDIVVKMLLCFRILAHLKFSNFSPIQFREIWGQLYVNNIKWNSCTSRIHSEKRNSSSTASLVSCLGSAREDSLRPTYLMHNSPEYFCDITNLVAPFPTRCSPVHCLLQADTTGYSFLLDRASSQG